jgi:hypothetical protein
MRYFLLCIIILPHVVFAQQKITFQVEWNKNILPTLPATLQLDKQTLEIKTLKLYLSNVRAISDNKTIYATKRFYLYDAERAEVVFDFPEAQHIKQYCFTLGIDSATNSEGVMGDVLDPTQGMYWTWQSGYINFKLEGNFHNEKIAYHLGGYSYPYNSSRSVCVDARPNSNALVFRLDSFLLGLSAKLPKNIMSPGEATMQLSDLLSTCFEIH